MAQIGEGHEAQGAAPQVLTFETPSVGEILADRYQIEAHIGDDTLGRQLFRGSDVVLRRPVTVVLRQPGGAAASEMLAAAVASSRVVHPHLVGVYDAIDEGERAYVVREWIDGVSLREAIAEGPMDVARAVAIAWAVADAVAALHETGVVHGNVNPGTVMIAQDGRVMLADARADEAATTEADVRAIGGVLYCALTSFWPKKMAGPSAVPDGVYDADRLVAPGDVREDIPEPVNTLTMSLLDLEADPPAADALSSELGAISEASASDEEGSLGFAAFDAAAVAPAGLHRPTGRRIAAGIGALLALALVGTLAATKFGGGSGTVDPNGSKSNPAASASASVSSHQLKVAAGKVRVIDPPGGDGAELHGADKTVDGTPEGWNTQEYNASRFGDMKAGMGILLDLETPRRLATVQVELKTPGADVEVKVGQTDLGNGQHNPAIDLQIVNSFTKFGESRANAGVRVAFVEDRDPVRYVLVWLTNLPPNGSGKYQETIEEITINVQ